ncbi:MAG TPA: DUF222 domain-containing protein, partial [Acidimicrobiales bacterium]|nr:DUF222 domain-containing protein [Acidimicrobiales bacterium]
MCVRIAELRESLGEYAAGFDAALLSAEQAEVVVEQASRIEKAAATLKALAAARLAETGCWKTAGDRSAAHQLARRTGTTVVAAAGVIDTARRLQALPQTSAAARRGELSFEQASAIAQAAGVDPGSEGALLQTASCSPLAELREQCGRARAAAADDPEARRARIHQRRSLRSFTDAEGQWHLHSRNNPEVGAAIMAALDPFREAVFRRARSEARREPPEAYAADALAEMARCSGNGDLVPPAGTGLRAAVTRAEPEVGPGGGAVAEAEGGPGGAARAEPEVGPGAETGAETGAEAGGAPEIGPEVGPGGEGAAEVGAEVGAEAEGAAAGRASRPPNGRRAGPPKIIVRVDLGALLRGRPVEGEVCE